MRVVAYARPPLSPPGLSVIRPARTIEPEIPSSNHAHRIQCTHPRSEALRVQQVDQERDGGLPGVSQTLDRRRHVRMQRVRIRIDGSQAFGNDGGGSAAVRRLGRRRWRCDWSNRRAACCDRRRTILAFRGWRTAQQCAKNEWNSLTASRKQGSRGARRSESAGRSHGAVLEPRTSLRGDTRRWALSRRTADTQPVVDTRNAVNAASMPSTTPRTNAGLRTFQSSGPTRAVVASTIVVIEMPIRCCADR